MAALMAFWKVGMLGIEMAWCLVSLWGLKLAEKLAVWKAVMTAAHWVGKTERK